MKVMICGSSGMVGQSLLRIFQDVGIETIVCTRAIVDLTKREDVFQFIRREKPNVVIDAAAKVGGIIANSSFPVKFFIENVSIQNNLMEASNEFEVAKFIFLGSSCIYPRMSEQPMKEEIGRAHV